MTQNEVENVVVVGVRDGREIPRPAGVGAIGHELVKLGAQR